MCQLGLTETETETEMERQRQTQTQTQTQRQRSMLQGGIVVECREWARNLEHAHTCNAATCCSRALTRFKSANSLEFTNVDTCTAIALGLLRSMYLALSARGRGGGTMNPSSASAILAIPCAPPAIEEDGDSCGPALPQKKTPTGSVRVRQSIHHGRWRCLMTTTTGKRAQTYLIGRLVEQAPAEDDEDSRGGDGDGRCNRRSVLADPNTEVPLDSPALLPRTSPMPLDRCVGKLRSCANGSAACVRGDGAWG